MGLHLGGRSAIHVARNRIGVDGMFFALPFCLKTGVSESREPSCSCAVFRLRGTCFADCRFLPAFLFCRGMGTTGTTVFIGSCVSWRNAHRRRPLPRPSPRARSRCSPKGGLSEAKSAGGEDGCVCEEALEFSGIPRRRRSVVLHVGVPLLSAVLGIPGEGIAVVKQGLLPGRIPGLSESDEQGWRTYRRPDEKSGGHGVGWSPIIPYVFTVPESWEEVPVSIADLGGTEIDLRFASSREGRLYVIVAPILRFSSDLGDNVSIERIGSPEKVIYAFGPEVIGDNVEGKLLRMEVAEHAGRTYYQYELEPPHALITATAAGNRLYLFNVIASGLQWKKHSEILKKIADSFRVV